MEILDRDTYCTDSGGRLQNYRVTNSKESIPSSDLLIVSLNMVESKLCYVQPLNMYFLIDTCIICITCQKPVKFVVSHSVYTQSFVFVLVTCKSCKQDLAALTQTLWDILFNYIK